MASDSETTVSAVAIVLSIALFLSAAAIGVVTLLAGVSEDTEDALWLAGFGLVLPASLGIGLPLSARLGRDATAIAAVWATGVLGVVAIARFAYAVNGETALGTAWFLAALAIVGAVAVALAGPWSGRLGVLRRLTPGQLSLVPVALSALLLVGFAPGFLLHLNKLAAALAVSLGLAALYALSLRARTHGRWGIALDVFVVLLALATVHNLSLYIDPQRFLVPTGHVHQNFFLGPANDVLHGRALLVDSVSQYGVGLVYFIAAWSKLTSIGFGSLTLLSGLMTGVEVALIYAIIRLAGAGRALAVLGGAVVAVAAAFSGVYVPPDFPSTGGLRFALPFLVIAATMLGDRHPRARLLAPVAVATASLWSFETFIYSLGAFVAMHVVIVLDGRAPRAALAAGARGILPAAVAVVVAQIVFALLTLVFASDLPDWGWYFAFLSSYSVDAFLTFTMQPWSPGVMISAAYFASLVGVVVILVRAPTLANRGRPTLMAIAGTSVFGVASFTYFLSLSAPDRVPQVGVPAFVTIVLWLALLERNRAAVPLRLRVALLAAPVWMAGMLVVGVWPFIEDRAAYTPLALALPDGGDGGSLRFEVGTMRRSPPLTADQDGALRLLERHFPGDGPAPVLLQNENTVTTLVQARRVNALPVSHWLEDGIVLDRAWARMGPAVARLRPGTLLLTEAEALNPDPLYRAPLLQRTAAAIQRRFELVPVDSDGPFQVVRLEPRRR